MKTHAASLPFPPPEVSLYRGHCVALLRRYFCMSVEVGRLPAILGRELFTTRSETYHVHSFEDTVVFVIDVERCLDRLHPFDKELVARIVLQEYSEEEAARLLHCGLRTIERRLPDAIDSLTHMFLRSGILEAYPDVSREAAHAGEPQTRCTERVPQRAGRQAMKNSNGHASSHLESTLVKSPISANSSQACVSTRNIKSSDVAGLPPSVCYAEYVS